MMADQEPHACPQCLHDAVKADNIRRVKQCFQSPSVSADAMIDKKTPLFHAIENGSLNMVVLLLKHKADINQLSTVAASNDPDPDINMFTLLMKRESAVLTAVRLKRTDILRVLLKYGTFDSKSEDSRLQKKVMSVAIHNNDAEVTKILIAHGFDMNDVSKKYKTGLHKAAYYGHAEIVVLLLKSGAKITRDNAGITPLHLAAKNGHFEALEALLGYCHGTYLPCMEDFTGMSPMAYACTEGHLPVIGTIMAFANEAHGLCIFQSARPLCLAAFHGHFGIVQYFVNTQVRINSLYKGESPLTAAIKGKQLDIVMLLLKSNAQLDLAGPNGLTPLQAAILCKNYTAMKLLVQNGAEVNCTIKKPGLLKIKTKEIVEFLLHAGYRKPQEPPPTDNGFIKLTLKDQWVEDYLNTPLSLLDICRFKVRTSLKTGTNGSSIKKAVDKVGLPMILQDLVLMRDIDITEAHSES